MGGEKSPCIRINLIQKVVDISNSGTDELESADSHFFIEVESELREVCDALALLCKASFHSDDEDAEHQLLSGTLAPYYYGGAPYKVFTQIYAVIFNPHHMSRQWLIALVSLTPKLTKHKNANGIFVRIYDCIII